MKPYIESIKVTDLKVGDICVFCEEPSNVRLVEVTEVSVADDGYVEVVFEGSDIATRYSPTTQGIASRWPRYTQILQCSR